MLSTLPRLNMCALFWEGNIYIIIIIIIIIYSRAYTAHGALGRLLWSLTAANVVEGPADPFRWLKKPSALPFAAFHHLSWDYGIVFDYGLAKP
jgi:hypothetical protein